MTGAVADDDDTVTPDVKKRLDAVSGQLRRSREDKDTGNIVCKEC